MVKTSLIVAVAQNGIIGNKGQIPWKMRSDMKFFRQTTMNKPVIMGRKTWESLKAPLVKRDNIVVTRQKDYVAEGAFIVPTIEEALSIAHEFALIRSANEIMIMGGGQIYELTKPLADKIYFTRIHKDVEGDAFFEPLDLTLWHETSCQRFEAGSKDDADYSFIMYEKITKTR